MSEALAQMLRDGGAIALPVALLAGVIAGLNPCCLPIYPTAVGACAALRRGTLRANLRMAAILIGSVVYDPVTTAWTMTSTTASIRASACVRKAATWT